MTLIEKIVEIDRQVFLLINSRLANPFLDTPFLVITWLGEWAAGFIALGLLAPRGWKVLWRHFLFLLVSLLALTGVVGELKDLVHRPRPAAVFEVEVSSGHPEARFVEHPVRHARSMPSGHTAFAFAALGYCALRGGTFPLLAWLLAALIAYSRIYVGQHFPGDVLAGACLGALWAYGTSALFAAWEKRSVAAGGTPSPAVSSDSPPPEERAVD